MVLERDFALSMNPRFRYSSAIAIFWGGGSLVATRNAEELMRSFLRCHFAHFPFCANFCVPPPPNILHDKKLGPTIFQGCSPQGGDVYRLVPSKGATLNFMAMVADP